MLILKSPKDTSKNKADEKAKSISIQVNFDKDKGNASLNLNLDTKIIDATINPDNKNVTLSFDIKDTFINIPINNYDNINNEIIIVPTLKEKETTELISVPKGKENTMDKTKPLKKANLSKDEAQNNGEINYTSSHSKSYYSDSQNENSNYDSTLRNEQLLSYDEKDFANFQILVRENNENLLNEFHREKIEGTTFESIANKTFELMCNISLNRNIEVKNYINKSAKRINDFFSLRGENKIKPFQIDSHISKLTGKELKKIKEKFKDNFFFFEDLQLKDTQNYEIIGEISQNIINNSRQKIAQQFNYIHLIKLFNNYKQTNSKKFISLCKSYGFNNNNEKIFILITDGSYIKTKYFINIMTINMQEIEKLINGKKGKNDIINLLSNYFKENKALDILDINIERFYYFCLFYINLKNAGIKFCFCFISDVIEDKLENILSEKIKIYKNDIKKEESEEKIKKKSEFITKIKNIIEKNDKLKSSLMIISDKINRKIKDFVGIKNTAIFKKLDNFFVSFNDDYKDKFNEVCKILFKGWNEQESLLKKICLNTIFFCFIFFIAKTIIIDSNKVKEIIKGSIEGISFDVIQKYEKDEIDNYINSQNIKDKIKIKIFLSNDDDTKFINNFGSLLNKKDYFFFNLDSNGIANVELSAIIFQNFEEVVNLFFNDFYLKNKNYLSGLKENKQILSKKNIIQKIKYDLTLLKIKTENNDSKGIQIDFPFQTNKGEKNDEQLKSIGEEYYKSMKEMIKELLDIAKIKNNNNIMKFFIDEKQFFYVFNTLTENLRYKCFYKHVIFEFIKAKVSMVNKITLNNITLKDIIKKKDE